MFALKPTVSSGRIDERTAPGNERDAALARQAAAGDAAALTILLQDSRRRLCEKIARKIPTDLCGFLDAEDVVQEAHIATFRHIHLFQPQGPDSFYRWVATVAIRKLRDAVRRRRADKRGGQTLPPVTCGTGLEDSVFMLLEAVAAPGHTASSTAVRREAAETVLSELELLPHDQRQAVWLVHIERLPVSSAAAQMGQSKPAVYGLCRRGLDTLRDRLASASRFR